MYIELTFDVCVCVCACNAVVQTAILGLWHRTSVIVNPFFIPHFYLEFKPIKAGLDKVVVLDDLARFKLWLRVRVKLSASGVQ